MAVLLQALLILIAVVVVIVATPIIVRTVVRWFETKVEPQVLLPNDRPGPVPYKEERDGPRNADTLD